MKRVAHFSPMQPSCHRTIAEKIIITQGTQIKSATGENYVTLQLTAACRDQGNIVRWCMVQVQNSFPPSPLWV